MTSAARYQQRPHRPQWHQICHPTCVCSLPAAFTAGDVVERGISGQLANQGRDDFVDIAHQTVVG